jgi:hypothetical protein
MRSRTSTPSVVLFTLAACWFASCAASPPRRDETLAILEIRDEYLRTNPAGHFNAVIARSEVAVGMGYYDVLAAWGLPNVREMSKSGDERWSYVLLDDNGVDWIRYDFVFTEKKVAEWETSRNVASAFSAAPDDPRGVSRRVPPAPAASLGDGARKGGTGEFHR